MAERIWLSRMLVDAMQLDQIREHGGQAGLRDENLLESALERPRNKQRYEEGSDLYDLAAACEQNEEELSAWLRKHSAPLR